MLEMTEAWELQKVCTSCAVLSDLDGLEIACEHKRREVSMQSQQLPDVH